MAPETRYARTADGTHVAYQVHGSGPIDLLVMRAWHSNLEHEWEEPVLAGILRRLGSVGRVVRIDRRGTGLSDHFDPAVLPTLEDRIDDIRAALDAVGSERVVPIGLAHGGALCSFFAAAHPERTAGLVLWGPPASMLGLVDPSAFDAERDAFRRGWGTLESARDTVALAGPSRVDDEALIDWVRSEELLTGTAEEAVAQWELVLGTNVADILPTIHVPVLVAWRSGSRGAHRETAGMLPNATIVELPGPTTCSSRGTGGRRCWPWRSSSRACATATGSSTACLRRSSSATSSARRSERQRSATAPGARSLTPTTPR